MIKSERIHDYLAEEKLGAVAVFGVDNLTYLHDVVLPFPENFPDKKVVGLRTVEGESAIICPFDWKEAVYDQGFQGTIRSYDLNKKDSSKMLVQLLEETIHELNISNARIGIDESRTSKEITDYLHSSLSSVSWVGCDAGLRGLRMVKTPDEVKRIETAAYQSEIGIITALMHLEGTVDVPGYFVNEFTERVRVHIFEFGGSGVGHMATQVGDNAQMYYTPQRGTFMDGELVRIDVTNHFEGYWSNAGRMAVIGQPSDIQKKSYVDNLTLKSAAVGLLRKGNLCNEIYGKVKSLAEAQGLSFWEEAGVGHGVGVSHWEPPFINAYDETELKPGMVIALDIYNIGPQGELLHSKDIYEITEDDPRLLSWYKTWDRLYAVYGFRTTH